MRVLDHGHHYACEEIDGEGEVRIKFVKREGLRYPGNFSHHPGTTSQEVMRALIHRALYVNQQIPCWQTRLSVWCMRLVIFLYEHRAKKVKGRRPLSWRLLSRIERFDTCRGCGHILCIEDHV